MAQLSDDCFAFGGALMAVEEAQALIMARVPPPEGEEQVPLSAARGRRPRAGWCAGRSTGPA